MRFYTLVLLACSLPMAAHAEGKPSDQRLDRTQSINIPRLQPEVCRAGHSQIIQLMERDVHFNKQELREIKAAARRNCSA